MAVTRWCIAVLMNIVEKARGRSGALLETSISSLGGEGEQVDVGRDI